MRKKQDGYDILNEEMGITGEEHESIVRWFARQGYRVRQKIVTQFSQSLIETGSDRLNCEDIYKNFLKVIIKNGWRISEKISSKYHLRKEELLEADQNEIEQALTFSRQSRRRAKYKQVRSNIGLLLRLREEGMTYKDIAMYFTKVKKIKVSKTLIYNLITEYKEQNKNKV
jgi:hypothetical protein